MKNNKIKLYVSLVRILCHHINQLLYTISLFTLHFSEKDVVLSLDVNVGTDSLLVVAEFTGSCSIWLVFLSVRDGECVLTASVLEQLWDSDFILESSIELFDRRGPAGRTTGANKWWRLLRILGTCGLL